MGRNVSDPDVEIAIEYFDPYGVDGRFVNLAVGVEERRAWKLQAQPATGDSKC